MRNTEREAEAQAEGEAGSLRGPRYGTRYWDPGTLGSLPEPKGDAQPPSLPQGAPPAGKFQEAQQNKATKHTWFCKTV